MGSLLLGKLSRAELREADKALEDTVSRDRFAIYRTACSDQPKWRLLNHPRDMMWPPAEIFVASPLGVTLLGLSAGDRMDIIGNDVAEPPWVEVVRVDGAAVG